jgi:hypothetical protein
MLEYLLISSEIKKKKHQQYVMMNLPIKRACLQLQLKMLRPTRVYVHLDRIVLVLMTSESSQNVAVINNTYI